MPSNPGPQKQANLNGILDDLPTFMRQPYPAVKFNSAFPPFTTKVRVRGVMERAGFDVYHPDRLGKPGRPDSPGSSALASPISPTRRTQSNSPEQSMGPQPTYQRDAKASQSDGSLRSDQRRNYTSPDMAPSARSNPSLLGSRTADSLSRGTSSKSGSQQGAQDVPAPFGRGSESESLPPAPNRPAPGSQIPSIQAPNRPAPNMGFRSTPGSAVSSPMNSQFLRPNNGRSALASAPNSMYARSRPGASPGASPGTGQVGQVGSQMGQMGSQMGHMANQVANQMGNQMNQMNQMGQMANQVGNQMGHMANQMGNQLNQMGQLNSPGAQGAPPRGPAPYTGPSLHSHSDGNNSPQAFSPGNQQPGAFTPSSAGQPFSPSLNGQQYSPSMNGSSSASPGSYSPSFRTPHAPTGGFRPSPHSSNRPQLSIQTPHTRDASETSFQFQTPTVTGREISLEAGNGHGGKASPFDDDSDSDGSFRDSSISSFDAKFERTPKLGGGGGSSSKNSQSPSLRQHDASVDQLLAMRKHLSSHSSTNDPVPDIRVGVGEHSPSRSARNSIYDDPDVKRLSTMQTDDMRIYNMPDSGGDFDMNTIHEAQESTAETSPSSRFNSYGARTDSLSALKGGIANPMDDSLNAFGVPGLQKITVRPLEDVELAKKSAPKPAAPKPAQPDPVHGHSGSNASGQSQSSTVKDDSEGETEPLRLGADTSKLDVSSSLSAHDDAKSALSRKSSTSSVASVKYPPGKGPCRKCGKPILPGQKSIWSKDSQLSGQWHRRCFSCYSCSQKFSKGQSCYVYNDRPYCERHFHELNGTLCRICGRGVEGECLQNEVNEVFHMDCLKCSYCGVPIRTDYFIYNGKVMCEDDAMEQMRQMRGGATSDKVVKRRTRMMYV